MDADARSALFAAAATVKGAHFVDAGDPILMGIVTCRGSVRAVRTVPAETRNRRNLSSRLGRGYPAVTASFSPGEGTAARDQWDQ